MALISTGACFQLFARADEAQAEAIAEQLEEGTPGETRERQLNGMLMSPPCTTEAFGRTAVGR